MSNHDLGEILTALISQGLELKQFQGLDYTPYNCFSGTEKIEDDRYIIKHLGNRIPMVYALTASKK